MQCTPLLYGVARESEYGAGAVLGRLVDGGSASETFT